MKNTKLSDTNKPKLVVSVLIKNNGKYLLVKERLESGREMWIIPGGKVEFGETLEDAAKREIFEEVGIKARNLKYLCFKEAIFPQFNYHTVIFFYESVTKKVNLDKDIEGKVMEARWVTQEEVKKLPLVDSAEWLFTWIKKEANAHKQ